jgi:nucleotide-binding universal stress UspA family protein
MATRAPRQKFLVPFNFSKKSEMALDFALRYSNSTPADIYLFHVFEKGATDFRKLDKLNEEYLERMKQIVTQAVEKLHAAGFTTHVNDVHRRVANGKPGTEILKMAAGINSDMIFMGSPSSFGFRRLIFKAPCTMILCREKDSGFVA